MDNFYLLAAALRVTTYPGLFDLFARDRDSGDGDALLRSGNPYVLDRVEINDLEDPMRTITVLAIDLASGDVVGHVSMHRKTTIARGTTAHVELMLVDPRFRGRGIARPLLMSAIRRAARDWRTVRAVTLTSEPQRVRARALYTSLGFEHRSGDDFRLLLDRYPWRRADGNAGVDAVIDYAQGRFAGQDTEPGALHDALIRACAGGVSNRNVQPVLDPIALCRYKVSG